MPRIMFALPPAILAAREGLSANQFYESLKLQGMGARRSEVLQLYGIVRNIVARQPEQIFADITRNPADEELQEWNTRKATGILQTVALVYRDKVTGHISQTWWRTVSEEGVVRETALAQAIDAYSEHAKRYGQDLIGAIHTSAYRQIPIGT